MTIDEKREAIRKDPNYGQVVCRCENVTKAEILAAIHNPLGVSTMTGIKNRASRAGARIKARRNTISERERLVLCGPGERGRMT